MRLSKAISALCITAALAAAAACVTSNNSGYVICNDLDANVTCPDNTANVVIGM